MNPPSPSGIPQRAKHQGFRFPFRGAAWAFAVGVVCAVAPGQAAESASSFAELTNAFHTRLVPGRAFLKDFPGSKTRNALVQAFLGEGGAPSRHNLKLAIQAAIAIREGEEPEPESFPANRPPVSIQAKVVAWEALESLLTGYLFAGNRDLLNSLRVAYPGNSSATDNRERPQEEATEFPGTAQKPISYARLYFLQGIKDVLEYVAEDPTGRLRATGTAYPTMPHYVTFDDELSELLPFLAFDDPNFGGPAVEDRQPSQSVAFLYGSSLERLGLAAVGYADQLWRAAFAGPGGGTKRDSAQKAQMLERATEVLQQNIHAQFLAVLPLAAQLSDGTDGSLNEFELAKINLARVSVTDALRLRELILAGEKPTQTALISAWDVATIEEQIRACEDARKAVEARFANVEDALGAVQGAQSENFNRKTELRLSLESQLHEITGLDPGAFDGLGSEIARRAYLEAVTNKFDGLINAGNPSDPSFQHGSLMAIQALRLMQSLQEARAKRAEVDGFAQRMRIELQRNKDEAATVMVNGIAYEAIELAIAAATAAPNISICACGTASGTITHTDPSSAAVAAQAALRVMRVASETVAISRNNSQALIRNLLIDQQIAIEELGVVVLNVAIAGAELRQLLARANRLVEDHMFFHDGTKDHWYRDPSLAFRAEKAEEEYQGYLQEYRIGLYKLARLLEAAWTERFTNPVKKASPGASEPLNNGTFDEFTEAESIFGVGDHLQARAFFNALKAWDGRLRDGQFRGAYSSNTWDASSFQGEPLSLRRDLFKLIDYRYDHAANEYVKDEELERRSIQRFRAILLDLAHRDPANQSSLTRLRIEFPITYNQSRVIPGQQSPVPIVLRHTPGGAGGFDQFWNHRVRELGLKIVGKNVFAGGNAVPVAFELFGTVERIGFFPDSLYTASRNISTFQIPLYQRDPDLRVVGEPFFGSALSAALGTSAVSRQAVIRRWPLFCDRFVLRIGAQGTLRIENIEDIELHLTMEYGSPPPIPWPQ